MLAEQKDSHFTKNVCHLIKVTISTMPSQAAKESHCCSFSPQLTRKGAYRSPTTTKRPGIQELESLIIGMALSRNPKLMNTQGIKWLQQLTVDGFLNSKSKNGSAAELRKLLGK
ncbi:MAG: hypothetical protein AB2731_10155 [Candidatus Thiodiazotropha sp.]